MMLSQYREQSKAHAVAQNYRIGSEYSDVIQSEMLDFEGVNYELKIKASDGEIKALALTNATRIEYALSRVSEFGRGIFISYMMHHCDFYGVRYPKNEDLEGIVARLICQKWWTKKLRIAHARKCEKLQIDAGNVCRVKDLYCSDDTLKRRTTQLKRNAELLEGIEIQNESGYKMTLAEAAAAGMANPHNRVSELLTRVKGFGELAEKYGHKCVFITLTAPSKYHAVKYNKETKRAYKNKAYENFTPSDTQKYLTGQWAKCRARLAREGVRFYGLRVVEPHHDGTPHWHGSIWLKNDDDMMAFKAAVTDYFLNNAECNPNERGAAKNRVKFNDCDKRGAVGYMLKYILKNMRARAANGESDEGDITSQAGAERVEAWAATWAIRQFQQVGGHSVTVWRELRRVDEVALNQAGDKFIMAGLDENKSLKNLMAAWRAAQKTEEKKANYAEFVEAMGGLETKPKEALIKLNDEYIVGEGIYGRSIIHKIYGVLDVLAGWVVGNNRQAWVVL
ncbi:MAG: replication endonuclease [Methylotenera sp.]|nr:replication endonuclease [Methylotenera sp.]